MASPADEKHWLDPPQWWKKSKPLRWVPIVVGLAIVLPGLWVAKEKIAPSSHPEKERFTEMVSDPVGLLDNLNSYESLDAVSGKLTAAQVKFQPTSVRPAPSGKYPPRDRDTIVANEYKHLGVVGKLTLEFFNDRLYEASFVPSEPAEYAPKLHASDKRVKVDRVGSSEQVMGNLRIATNVDFAITDVGKSLQTKPYVIWQDLRLTKLLDEWDRRFVALPGRS